MSEQVPPFELSISSNDETLIFNESWSHQRHYHAVFNAQADILPARDFYGKPWAMLADWRKWLIQTPKAERLCVRTIGKFVARQLTHFAVICENHPVAKWQAEKVKAQHPELHCAVFTDIDAAKDWLFREGFDIDFSQIDFKSNWLEPSEEFAQMLQTLGVDKRRFHHGVC